MPGDSTAAPRPDRYENVITAVLALTFGIVFFDRNALNYLMPFVLEDIPLTNAQIGLLAAGLAATWALSGIVAGQVSDRIGRRKSILLIAVVIFSFASFVTGLATSFFMLLGARLLMGLSEGPVLPLSQSLMAQASSPERRGLNMGLMQNVLSNLMGSLVAPLVVVALANAYGWRPAFLVTALPGLVAAALIWVYIKDPGLPAVAPRSDRKQQVFAFSDYMLALKNRNIALCLAISGLMVGWMITGWVFLPLYFTSVIGFTPSQMSMLMAVLGVSGAVAGFVVPALSDKFGRRPVIALGCALGAVTPLAVLFWTGAGSILTILVAFGWVAGGTFSIFMATVPAESAVAGRVTTGMALIMGIGELFGGAVMPAVAGVLADQFGLAAPLVCELVLASLAALLALGLRETSPRYLAQTSVARSATA